MKIDKIYTKDVHNQVYQSLVGAILMAVFSIAAYIFRSRITVFPLIFLFLVFLFFLSDFIRALVDLNNLEK